MNVRKKAPRRLFRLYMTTGVLLLIATIQLALTRSGTLPTWWYVLSGCWAVGFPIAGIISKWMEEIRQILGTLFESFRIGPAEIAPSAREEVA